MKKILIVVLLLVASIGHAQTAFKVSVVGKGEPVLLFPGFTCPGEVWNDVVAELSKKNECHIFTFAGFGGVAPIEMPWFSSIKSQVLDYVKQKQLKKPTIIGHSLGGTLGLWLAATETTTFKKVIVVDGLPGAIALMNPSHKMGDIIPYNSPQSKAQLEMDDAAFDQMTSQMASFMCLKKEKHILIKDWMKNSDRKTYVYGYVDYLNADLRDEIAKITIPVTVLAAAFPTKAFVQPNYDKQFEKLPQTQIEYIEDTAHFIMFDQPDILLQKIMKNMP